MKVYCASIVQLDFIIIKILIQARAHIKSSVCRTLVVQFRPERQNNIAFTRVVWPASALKEIIVVVVILVMFKMLSWCVELALH